jgi:hypothetical protein
MIITGAETDPKSFVQWLVNFNPRHILQDLGTNPSIVI